MDKQKPVGRFAPTPSGRMHLGNVFAALVAWLSIRSRDGSLVLRMEDLDTQRTSEEFAAVLRMICDGWGWIGTWKRLRKASAAECMTAILKCSGRKTCFILVTAPAASCTM